MLSKTYLSQHKYYIFYKPYNVLNQFSKERAEHVTLEAHLDVPKDVYPVGRLDKDSEGLLILTNDKAMNSLLLSPSKKHSRTYMVQLDNDITDKAIAQVARGVQIKLDNGVYHTMPCEAKKLYKEPLLPERNPPIRVRKEIPTSWALITLTEGKNRQVRKMFAAVGYPVLRLVRVQIEDVKIGKMQPGEVKEMRGEELYQLLKIDTTTASAQKKRNPLSKAKAISEGKKSGPKTTTKPFAKSTAKPVAKPVSKAPTTKKSEPSSSSKPTTKPISGRPAKPSAGTYKAYRKK
jgi:23S rRNA pseudouridine2457 synthase